MKKRTPSKPRVSIVMGSDSDMPVMKGAAEILKEFGVPFELKIVSAHRTPVEMSRFASSAAQRGIQVIVAGAGGAAHLPGMIAAHSELPIIGVPVPMGALQGQDALLSIVQMPRGVPVATVAIGNAYNAGLLAVQILSSGGSEIDAALRSKLLKYKAGMRKAVLAKNRVKYMKK